MFSKFRELKSRSQAARIGIYTSSCTKGKMIAQRLEQYGMRVLFLHGRNYENDMLESG